MSEQKEKAVLPRRRLIKSAIALGALPASASAAFAQSAVASAAFDPKRGDILQNNGVSENLKIRKDRLSDEAKQVLLELKSDYKPVAVKYLAVKPDNFGLDYPQSQEKLSLCQFVCEAQKSGKAFYVDASNENCMGRMVLGMLAEPPIGASGQAGFDFGVFRSQAANARLYQMLPKMIPGTVNYVIFAPIDQCDFNPDVVVFTVPNETAGIIMRATSYISGDLWESKSSCVISCAWTYVYPWITGKVNHFITGHHHGMARRAVYPAGLEIIVVPYQKLDELVLALREMDWKLISFRSDEASHAELKRRMRNWDSLSKQIDANSSFALPENKPRK